MKTPLVSVLAVAMALLGIAVFPLIAGAGSRNVMMLRAVPYAKDAFVRPAVRDECRLETRVADYIVAASEGAVSTVDKLPTNGKASVLEVRIADTTESGNAFIGRHKSLTLEGELRQNGKVVGSFRARRSTMGGVFGGYKGNCSFLARCAKTLGRDVAKWLRSPTMNARLGEG
jgi:hypothetical protein